VQGEGRRPAIPHVSALDGARGLAVAGVVFFHGGHLTGGYLGVDFFFTLSGFLITSLLLAETQRTGSIGLGGFWARRARRLLPALAVLMAGIAVYCWVFASSDQLAQIRGDAFATLAYSANWREVFAHQNYFALFTSPSPLNHTWSLAIEEQFYVIWPLIFVGLLAIAKHAIAKAVLVTSLVLAAISSVLMITLYDPVNVTRAYFGTDTRAAAILLGAALAAWLTIHGPTRTHTARIALETLGLIGAGILAIAWTRLDGQSSTLYHGGFLLCGLAATAVIAAAVHPEPGPLARILSLRPLCQLGLISYGVYLYHWPIDVALDQKQMGFGGWPLFTFQTAVTLAAAIASYRIIEQPIRRGQLTSKQLAKLTPAITLALIIVITTSTTGSRPARTITALRYPLIAATKAFNTAPPGAQRIMIVGDSVADVLGQAMKQIDTKRPLAVFNATQGGCLFPSGIEHVRFRLADGTTSIRPGFPCDPAWEAGALEAFRPAVVIWIVSNPGERMWYRGRWIEACAEPYESLYQRDLRREITNLGAAGARVVITTTAYGLTRDEDRYADCDNRLRRKIAGETRAQLVDLFSYVCPHGVCREKQDGVMLRPDGLHYAGAGGRIVARWLVDQVGSAG
jgi:peptidoglycan/LPS O-acetylase OafA/YrhL